MLGVQAVQVRGKFIRDLHVAMRLRPADTASKEFAPGTRVRSPVISRSGKTSMNRLKVWASNSVSYQFPP